MAHDEDAVARALAALSAAEIVDAAALRRAPRFVESAALALANVPSRRLGKLLARFDAQIRSLGLSRAARAVLARLGAQLDVTGAPPQAGALVVINHPGAYDALAAFAALGRDDVAVVASERAFLRALPNFCEHVVFVADSRTSGSATGRAAGLRSALAWLTGGGVLVQFGAGAIEPDARFTRNGDPVLGAWQVGTGVLASRAAALGVAIVPAFVSGVHSPRAKRLALVRFAERRGVTTIAPLVQATMPGFRDVRVAVRFGAPIDRAELEGARGFDGKTAVVRSAVESLARE